MNDETNNEAGYGKAKNNQRLLEVLHVNANARFPTAISRFLEIISAKACNHDSPKGAQPEPDTKREVESNPKSRSADKEPGNGNGQYRFWLKVLHHPLVSPRVNNLTNEAANSHHLVRASSSWRLC